MTEEQRAAFRALQAGVPVHVRRVADGAEFVLCRFVPDDLPWRGDWYDVWNGQGKFLHHGISILPAEMEWALAESVVLANPAPTENLSPVQHDNARAVAYTKMADEASARLLAYLRRAATAP